jgi:uncharacterized SAM-binding protein YcdF (DUF218 family)
MSEIAKIGWTRRQAAQHNRDAQPTAQRVNVPGSAMTGRENGSKTSRGASSLLERASGRWRLLRLGLAAALLAPMTLFFAGFALFVLRSPTPPADFAGQADGIVVLTGGPQRINEALELLRNHQGRRLLITGVHPHTSERRLSQLSGEESLFSCCVDIDRIAADTRGNAAEASRWAEQNHFERLIVVTSDYHMARALLEFSRRMPNRTLTPWPVSALPELSIPPALVWARMWLAEYVKYLLAVVAPAATTRQADI